MKLKLIGEKKVNGIITNHTVWENNLEEKLLNFICNFQLGNKNDEVFASCKLFFFGSIAGFQLNFPPTWQA